MLCRLRLHAACRQLLSASGGHGGGEIHAAWRKPVRCAGRSFQTSGRRQVPPPLMIVTAMSMRAPVLVATRVIRRYLWPRLSPRTRAVLKRLLISTAVAMYVGMGGYAYSHTDVINGRRRVMLLSEEELRFLDEIARDSVTASIADTPGSELLTSEHKLYQRVSRVMVQLIKANPRADAIPWELAVVSSPSKNAVSFPGGTIVVFTGILDVAKDRNDLAILLGHEMAHTILRHQEEAVSERKFLNLLTIPITVAVNASMGLGTSVYLYFMEKWTTEIFFSMPYSRVRETEADELGMEMAARACFNMKNTPDFFQRLCTTSEDMEWLSTHPTGARRKENLTIYLDEIVKLTRDDCIDFTKWFKRNVVNRPTVKETTQISHSHLHAQRIAATEAIAAAEAAEAAAAKAAEAAQSREIVSASAA